jgi:enamine deaminase RidA (YjgF/YER057c/UK114 family)
MTNPAIDLIRSAELAATPYAHAASIPASARIIMLAGSCPIDAESVVQHRGDVAAQATLCLDNLELALAAAGATLDDIVSTRVLVATSERDDLSAAWTAVHERFANHEVPSTLVGVTVLGYDGQLVEIEATAIAAGD